MMCESRNIAFIRIALMGLATLFASDCVHAEATPKKNVLFIISDDLATTLGCYGHEQAITPHLDRLAAEGTSFSRAYCQFPACLPSRNSIMTGMYPESIGTVTNDRRTSPFRKLRPEVRTLPESFKDAGYVTARVSKIFHMGIPPEITAGKSRYGDAASWSMTHDVKAPEAGDEVKGIRGYFSEKKSNGGMMKLEAEVSESEQADGMAADQAIRYLNHELKDKPFFLAVGFVRPHVPFVAPKKYYDLYDWEKMKLPEYLEGHLENVPRHPGRTARNKMDEDRHKKAIEAYLACVSYMDAQVGRVIAELDRLKLRDNTIIVFVSDHGFNLGEHRAWQKKALWEDVSRVPLIIVDPDKESAKGKVAGEIVELIDIYPTLMEMCGLEVDKVQQGQSLVPLLEEDGEGAWKEKTGYTLTFKGARSIHQGKWHFNIWDAKFDQCELYDLQADPLEHHNLAASPEHQETVRAFKRRMTEKMESVMLPGAAFNGHVK